MKFVPKKYMENMDEVFKDSDGYWAYTKKGFRFAETECHTAHGKTQKEILSDIRSMEPCDCDECMGIGHFANLDETEVVETEVVEDQEIADFKRYTELLSKVYDTRLSATAEDQQELDALGYKLELMGVADIISEMNFDRLQKKLEGKEEIEPAVLVAEEVVEFEVHEPALEVRIRDKKTNQIESWYCQLFKSKEDYDNEVNHLFDQKKYFKNESIFEIEHINVKKLKQVKSIFRFKHRLYDSVIYTCRVHPDAGEITWTTQGIFHSSLYSLEHLKLSIKYGDWIIVDQ